MWMKTKTYRYIPVSLDGRSCRAQSASQVARLQQPRGVYSAAELSLRSAAAVSQRDAAAAAAAAAATDIVYDLAQLRRNGSQSTQTPHYTLEHCENFSRRSALGSEFSS